ncbi:NADPH-dependent aldo-keto reductase, chloroplastic-like [Chenopodium quinoa]|uniref:NADP-dependent oxidoreductase domain-containing protein n=1 Tax=Chenopodium quinoa TaxID=63459 RepID=A0A803KT52_CHEQI|nr:NADPH-dependent aldo-keto reductase, chloroplastic-like [Chenopodium quinoa]
MRCNLARLNTGNVFPLLGLGTYSSSYDHETTQKAIHMAIKMGYRHFDTAKIYGTEPALGKALTEAISDGVVERKNIFVTSKLWSSDHDDPVSALNQSLQNLGMEYVDLYLVHWPVRFKSWAEYPVPNEEDFEETDMESTWAGMEKCLDLGLCKAIGVSNFSTRKLQHLMNFATVCPAVNQVEMHPMWRQNKLRKFCSEHKVHVSAYMPLGGPGNFWGSTSIIKDPIIQSIAQKHRATPAQVALRWGMQKGVSVIVKSFNEGRMREIIGALDLKLDDYDMISIEKLAERKILRGDHLINKTTSPYRTIEQLWDYEI